MRPLPAQMPQLKEFQAAARVGFMGCMGEGGPAPTGDTAAWLNAMAELLEVAHRADAELTRHYLSLYLNEGPLHEPRLAPLCGSLYDVPLETVRADMDRLLPPSVGKHVLRGLLLMFRQETRLRPMLLCLSGLLKIARGDPADLPEKSLPTRLRALDLAYVTFFENAARRGPPRWTGRTFGAASVLFRNEVAEAEKTFALSNEALDVLGTLAASVGEGGDAQADGSERLPIHRLRNNVYHGDATFEPNGQVELGLSEAWVERVATEAVGQVKVIPASEFTAAEETSEGLLCLVAGFEAAARKALRVYV